VTFLAPHEAGAALAAFLASFVEFVEAMTVVLAVGVARGWRNALAGATAATLVLTGVLAIVGPRAALPAAPLRAVIGVLTLLFGLRWLRKAVLRAAGLIALHDEAAAYAQTRESLSGKHVAGWDGVALAAAFQIVLMEGSEVALIVAAVAAGGGAFMPASIGALGALVAVMLLGVTLHRPMTRIPENAMKCGVGIMLCAFGTFWAGEAVGARWPGGEWALPLLGVVWAGAALAMIWTVRA
jgi:uncharacterized membrane protein